MRARRIIWLGNHKLLLNTELPRLRQLGFEVFHPPNRTVDRAFQSATADWKPGPTTLPPEVHAKLAKADFYEQPLSAETFDLLNRHFDAAIVTIQARWFVELLRGFRGKIVYRAYGDSTTVSEQVWSLGAFRAVVARDDLWFVPHAEEYGCQEHAWLRRRQVVAPYCVDETVASARDTWSRDPSNPEIVLTCPNINGNPYYGQHYQMLKQCFDHPMYRIFGLQPEPVNDPRVVGTVAFAELINRYSRAAAALYTYRWPAVCLLPPIEMMIVGGPVVFIAGSLLDRYLPADAPGRARDMLEARDKCERLRAGDDELARAIIRSQDAIRKRYLPEHVWPRFDSAINSIMTDEAPPIGPLRVGWSADAIDAGTIVALAQHDSLRPRLEYGRYTAEDPVVVRFVHLMKRLVSERPGFRFVLAVSNEGLADWHGLLSQHFDGAAFSLYALGPELPLRPESPLAPRPSARRPLDRVRSLVRRWTPASRLRRSWHRVRDLASPVVTPELARRARLISLHPDCDRALASVSLTRLYAERRGDAALASSLV